MKIRPILLALGILVGIAASAQTAARKTGEVLLQLHPESAWTTFMAELRTLPFAQYGGAVVPEWHMYRLHIDEAYDHPDRLLESVRQLRSVRAAQWNVQATDRNTEPNDTEWWRQDNLRLIQAPKAWAVSTGGVTPGGDTIVVAVLEKGAMRTHADLAVNWWYNRQEIPGNNIDDDGNGYTDDYAGFNARFGGDYTSANENHGTSVNGIIGAAGNNAEGVAGVNWHVKLMNVANTEFTDEIITGYAYVARMRRLYNQTGGQKGAFVVAANASFGIDNGTPQEYPLWCAMYDSLGAVGILGVCATANKNVDVDVVGDIPTTCPSPYMIAVTSVDVLDKKVSNAAYGAKNIDIAAPGQNVYTTRVNFQTSPPTSTYGSAGNGTSYATPHVAGAVALLYSFGCPTYFFNALTNPVAAAARARDAILESASANTSLQGITTTGGRLDLGNLVDFVNEDCGGLKGPLTIVQRSGNFGRGPYTAVYQTPDFNPYELRVFNNLGQLIHERALFPRQFELNQFEFEYNNLPSGMYFLTIGRGNNWVTEKFLKI